MVSVFISYSHQDAAFVDRLITDLRYSDVPATYDKWILTVGDSIIDRISNAIVSASSVIVIISKHSIASHWVRKELSLAMTSEINGGNVKVLPVVIDKCDLPAPLSDKFFAEFRENHFYYWGLSKLLDALDPGRSSRRFEQRYQKHDWQQLQREFEQALASGQLAQVKSWIGARADVLLRLFGRRYDTSDAINDFNFGTAQENIDYLIVNGQSYSFEFMAVRLGPVSWFVGIEQQLVNLASDMRRFIEHCYDNIEEFSRAACVRFEDGQIASSIAGLPTKHRIRGTFLVGRRPEYHHEQQLVRNYIADHTNGLVEVASYDRLLRAFTEKR